jgi:hypothetical protein
MTSSASDVETMTSVIEIPAAATIACGETRVRRFSLPKLRGSCRCSPNE